MTDRGANVGTSEVRSDYIEFANEYSYVAQSTTTAGSHADFANAQDASDGGAAANLTESGSATTYYAATSSGTAANPGEADGMPDDGHTTLDAQNEIVTVSGFPASGSGTLGAVEIKMQSHAQLELGGVLNNDDLFIEYSIGSGFTRVLSDYVPPIGAPPLLPDEEITIDISAEETTWTFDMIGALQVRVGYEKSGSLDGVDFNVDAIWVVVGSAGAPNSLDVQYSFNALPSGSAGTLEIRYRASGDTFHVEVWDGSAWTTRGAPLDSGSFADWTYTLTAQEQQPGAGLGPHIRFVDGTHPGGSQGSLEIDYARVHNG
jgi:hypothetical protein